ncbi:MAG: sensor histidine kinase [Caulobacteraceae bacterium]|nr:sensor histidine kinase [Caulobacteraceae bacterium]
MRAMERLARVSLTGIRARLGAALALALLPVLLLGAAQAGLTFQKDADERRATLALAAERSAATARARMESAQVLLQTLSPQTVGLDCAQRLAGITTQLPGYDNLIRFDAIGRVNCAAASVPGGDRRADDWFVRLQYGEPNIVVRAPADLTDRPGLLAAEAVRDAQGHFGGALVAIIDIGALRPELNDRALPQETQMALVDGRGRYVLRTDPNAFADPPFGFGAQARAQGSIIFHGRDANRQARDFSVAPLAGDFFIMLSTPSQGLWSWARLNPLSSILFPLLAFTVALAAVWVVTERVVVRWLHYLQRIAEIYAKGRFTVRPVQADRAPPEIRELAHALEGMADAITTRDASLLASIDQKDALMREIHHRVKNNLQVITSLVNMQQRALSDPSARAAMSDMRHRIGALALIYRALYQGADLKRVDLRQFLSDLIGQLITDGQDYSRTVRTVLHADELIIDPDKLAPLALFAVEAISNAQKHALAVKEGALHVDFSVDGDEAQLVIADEGSGEAPVLTGEGVGRALMTAFARQLRGRVELAANDRGGVTARLVFPTPAADAVPAPKVRVKRNRSVA